MSKMALAGSASNPAAEGHEHERDGAVAADEVLDPARLRPAHDFQIHRIENDHGRIRHAQRRGRIDPIALPARRAQRAVHGLRVVAALGADEHGQALEGRKIVRVLDGRGFAADIGRRGAGLRGAEEHGLDAIEIALRAHALEQDRADHAAPTDDADLFHDAIANSLQTRWATR
jgi:hypothetical protein